MTSIRDTAGQLLFCSFAGASLTPEEIRFVEKARPGGVLLFGHNMTSAAQTRALTGELQSLAARLGMPPFIIAVDDEGGRVSRMPPDIRDLIAPSQMAQAAAGGPTVARRCAMATARRLRRLGFTMDFAPVADVNNNPGNPIIGVRAFGADPGAVAARVEAALAGYAAEGIAACAKHFPGHGDTTVDSHLGLPVIHRSLAELEALELIPFVRAVAAGAPAIMTAHILYPEADPSGRPATLSPALMRGLLRDRLGFDGLLITDSLGMLAIMTNYGVADATRWSLETGASVLAPSRGIDLQYACFETIVDAIERDLFDWQESAGRVAAHKARWVEPLLARAPAHDEDAAAEALEEAAIMAGVAHGAITLLRNRGSVLPVTAERAHRPLLVDFHADPSYLAPGLRPGPILVAALRAHLPALRVADADADPTAAQAEAARALAADADYLIIVTRNAARLPAQAALARDLLALGRPAVVVAAREPYDLAALPEAAAYLATYSDPPVSMAALADVLCGVAPPAGRLPVPIPGLYLEGAGLRDFADPGAALGPRPHVTATPRERPDDGLLPYTPDLRPDLMALWDAATAGALPMSDRLWAQCVDDEPLFEPEDCRILRAEDGAIAGFAITRIVPDAELDADPTMARHHGAGHIMALAVHPRYRGVGYGSRLLAAAEARLRGQGATKLTLSGPPNHFVPGPPVVGGTGDFWRKRGYGSERVVVDLRRRLDDWAPPPEPDPVAAGEYTYRQGGAGEQGAILAFLTATFPGRWRYDLARAFARGYRPEDVTLLVDREGAIQGFLCAYHPGSAALGGPVHWFQRMEPDRWGGVGPLGVSTAVRGRGLGLGLVAAGVTYVHGRGVRDCAIDWTGHIAFYGKLGFEVWLRYWEMEKPA
jgi:beta-N-acetylhexosaminidase